MADSEVLQTTMAVTVDADSFEFKIPSIYDEMKIGMRMRDIRLKIDPNGGGLPDGLDGQTLYFNRACATFETMLLKASVEWPFTQGPGGPVVDSSKFPPDKVSVVVLAYQRLQEKLAIFRNGGSTDGQSDPQQAVAGQQDQG